MGGRPRGARRTRRARPAGTVLKKGLFFLATLLGLLAAAEAALRLGIALARRQRASQAAPVTGEARTTVLCYGGSFTHGFVVPADQAYPARLEALLNSPGSASGVQVINMARRGLMGVKHVRQTIRRDLQAFHPSLVLVEPNVQDFDLPEEGPPGLRRALDALAGLRLYRLGRLLFVPELTGDLVLELEGIPHPAQSAQAFDAPDAWVHAAFVCSALGKEHLVEDLLRRSVARRPTPDALLPLSERYIRRGERAGLENNVKALRALADGPEGGKAAFVLGFVLHSMGRHAEAERRVKQALGVREGAYFTLAQIYRAMGKQDDCEEALLKALRETGSWKAARWLSDLCVKQGRPDKAVEVFRRELALQDRMSLRIELGELYRKMGREDLAREVAPDWRALQSHLEEIAGAIRAAGAGAVFLVMAPTERLASAAIRETAERAGASFIDVAQAIEEQPEGQRKVLLQAGDIHFSPAGNRWAARLLAPAVAEGLRRREARLP